MNNGVQILSSDPKIIKNCGVVKYIGKKLLYITN